jgi:hypothetical protein
MALTGRQCSKDGSPRLSLGRPGGGAADLPERGLLWKKLAQDLQAVVTGVLLRNGTGRKAESYSILIEF